MIYPEKTGVRRAWPAMTTAEPVHTSSPFVSAIAIATWA